MRRKKMLYFSHVPWGWIKQRPQFLAEKLSQYLDVDVAERKSLIPGKKGMQFNKISKDIHFKPYYGLPVYNPLSRSKIPFLDWINEMLMRLTFKFSSYDYIWVTSVVSYYKIKHLIPSQCKLIFDCMDDELEFPSVKNNPCMCRIYEIDEIKLLKRADYIFCSSEHLKQVLLKRNKITKDIHVLNNASEFPIKSKNTFEYREQFKFKKDVLSIVYIGTIAEWFDFDSFLYLFERRKNVDLYLIGPQIGNIPSHDRIHWLGTCNHNEIWGIMKKADILVMPFVLNPLIESVNPVKLYEYIWANKPIVATRYRESEKFEDFVYLYSSKEEIISIYDFIIKDEMKSKESIDNNTCFIQCNTWESRVKDILDIIDCD